MNHRDERPEVVLTSADNKEHMFDDIPANTKLRIMIGESGEDSYVEYQRDDGFIRRLFTQKGGGEIRIRTDYQ